MRAEVVCFATYSFSYSSQHIGAHAVSGAKPCLISTKCSIFSRGAYVVPVFALAILMGIVYEAQRIRTDTMQCEHLNLVSALETIPSTSPSCPSPLRPPPPPTRVALPTNKNEQHEKRLVLYKAGFGQYQPLTKPFEVLFTGTVLLTEDPERHTTRGGTQSSHGRACSVA